MSTDDAAVRALFAPVLKGELALPAAARVLVFNAQFSKDMAEALQGCAVSCVQWFKPYAQALSVQGLPLCDAGEDGAYDAVFVLAPKALEETRLLLARALAALKPGGTLVCAAHNKAGGGRLEKMLHEFCAQDVQHLSAHKCRVVWSNAFNYPCTAALAALETAGRQRVCDDAFWSEPGLYGWDKIDRGSALLVDHLPPALKGRRGADFGCGYGYLSRAAVQRLEAPFKFYALDADKRAVDLCALNVPEVVPVWVDLTAATDVPDNLDFIVMNPPFHEGKKTDAALGQAFIMQAARALRPRGALWMVANTHLPYEAALGQHFSAVEKLFEGQGFKIFKAVK